MTNPYYWLNTYDQHRADVRNGKLRGIHAIWRGPIRGAYLYKDRPPVTFDYRVWRDQIRIVSSPPGKIGIATQGYEGTWTAEVGRSRVDLTLEEIEVHPRLGLIYLTKPVLTLEEIEARAREAHAADVALEAQVQADPLALLERELRGKDWYSHMSDDFSYWSAGEASDRRIQGIVSPLDDARKDQARSLYTKYAPQDFDCPF